MSGTTSNDFSSAVEYIVTSEASEAVTWTVTVTVVSGVLTGITAFSFAEQSGAATIGDGTIDIEVVALTDPAALVATFTLESGAAAAIGATPQVSGTTSNDFSSAVIYTVTAEDGTTEQDWTVTVTVAE